MPPVETSSKPGVDEAPAELREPGLVGDRQEGPARKWDGLIRSPEIDQDTAPVRAHGERTGSQQRDRTRQEAVLDGADPLVKRRLVIVGQDRDRLLGDDRAAIERLVHEVDRRAGDRRPVRQRVPDGMGARERRQERRVGVQDAVWVTPRAPVGRRSACSRRERRRPVERRRGLRRAHCPRRRPRRRSRSPAHRPSRSRDTVDRPRRGRSPRRAHPERRPREGPGGWIPRPTRATAIRPLTPRAPRAYREPPSSSTGTTSPMTVARVPPASMLAIVASTASGRDDDDHPDPAVERRPHLRVVEPAERTEQPHDRWHPPAAGIEPGAEARRKRPRNVARQAAAGDVGEAPDVGPATR